MFEGDSALRRLPVTDGLRAVAVLAVVLFHTFPAVAPGGYIGVDIFFVISGFVIAYRYLPRLVSGEVGFREFFARRIQRLVPAYLPLVVVVTIAAYVVLKPVDLYNYGQSLAAQAVYAQNFVFWLQGDYFEDALHKPLLHTWSLAVEEQFYLSFPLLVLLFRRGRPLGIAALALAFLGSLAIGAYATPISPKTSFYLLPMRVWEFAAGIGAALLFGRLKAGRLADPLFLAGLAAMLATPFAFGEAPFPGPHSYLAVGATIVICLVQCELHPRLAAILTNRVAQHFGAISYSWYLWHWPLMSFLVMAEERSPTLAERLAVLVAGYALAVASRRFVEQPALRRPQLRRPLYSLSLLGSFLAIALVCGVSLDATGGVLGRYSPAEANLYAATMDRPPNRCSFLERLAMRHAQICRLTEGTGPGVLLIGDSHADFMKHHLSVLARATGIPLYLTKQNCRPFDYGAKPNCAETVWRQVAADIRTFHITRIVAIGRWERFVTADQYRSGIERLLSTGASVTFQKVVPNAPWFDPARRAAGERDPPFAAADYAHDYAVENAALAALARLYPGRLTVVDPVPLLCRGAAPCLRDLDGKPLYIDRDHLSTPGRTLVAILYRPIFPARGKG